MDNVEPKDDTDVVIDSESDPDTSDSDTKDIDTDHDNEDVEDTDVPPATAGGRIEHP